MTRSKRPFEGGHLGEAWARAHDWPLPDQPYVPGKTPRPSRDDMVHRIADAAPDPTEPDTWRDNVAYLVGIRLYEAGYGWEAHEVWEPAWMHARANSPERALVQGLIQLANARLKQEMGQPKAVRRLVAIAADCFRDAASGGWEAVMGIDLAAVRQATTRLSAALEVADGPVPFPPLPIVHYNADKRRKMLVK